MSRVLMGSAARALASELKNIQGMPMEGFHVKLVHDQNLFLWEVTLFGPPDTIYEGGYFKAHIRFPTDYPFSPPDVRFLKKIWHPNIYESGEVCISILHPPVDDPRSGELACERWNPTQNVRSILLSVISLLNEPNTSNPANMHAAVMYDRWKKSNGEDTEYVDIIRQQVSEGKLEAQKDGVKIPMTVEEYCVTTVTEPEKDESDANFEINDFFYYSDIENDSSSDCDENDGKDN